MSPARIANVSIVTRFCSMPGGASGGAPRRVPSWTKSGKVPTSCFYSSTLSARRGRMCFMYANVFEPSGNATVAAW
jgi:hypothetical protein